MRGITTYIIARYIPTVVIETPEVQLRRAEFAMQLPKRIPNRALAAPARTFRSKVARSPGIAIYHLGQ